MLRGPKHTGNTTGQCHKGTQTCSCTGVTTLPRGDGGEGRDGAGDICAGSGKVGAVFPIHEAGTALGTEGQAGQKAWSHTASLLGAGKWASRTGEGL